MFDSEGNPDPSTVRALIDGGTEGFKAQARVIVPFQTSCYECTQSTIPPQITYALCTIRNTPRLPEHCIAWAYMIKWDELRKNEKLD